MCIVDMRRNDRSLEEMYLTITPGLTRTQIISQVLGKIKEETQYGEKYKLLLKHSLIAFILN